MTLFLTLKLEDETATAALAQKVSRQLQSGDVVFLSGDLGAGKTTFTRHLISAFGLNTKVKSPTYTLLETYDLPETAPAKTLHHFDLYRLTDPREWYSAGFEENINDTAIVVIEWAEKAEGALPKPDWRIFRRATRGASLPLAASSSAWPTSWAWCTLAMSTSAMTTIAWYVALLCRQVTATTTIR